MKILLHDLISQIANFSRQNVTVENSYFFHNIHHCSVQITSLITKTNCFKSKRKKKNRAQFTQ